MTTFGPKDADAWYLRNKHKLGVGEDPVIRAIATLNLCPESVLEIGCADGWRLAKLARYGVDEVCGVELSELAILAARKRFKTRIKNRHPNQHHEYVATSIRKAPVVMWARHDMIIHGFNLYVTGSHHLTRWVYHTDLMLKDGGYIVIHDFLPEHPYSRIFEHNPRLRSRKMDHAQLWLAHPAYRMAHRDTYGDGDDRTHVTIIKKNMANAFPLEEKS